MTGDASGAVGKGRPARFFAVPASGIGLVLLSMTTLQFGTAFAKMLMASAGVLGITFLRNVFSALVLWAVARPDVSRYSARRWKSAAICARCQNASSASC